MAQLIRPDGTPDKIVPTNEAIEWCKFHPNWDWVALHPETPTNSF